MAADTKVFQDMADAMLPLFDNMPQVVVLVEDNAVFHREVAPLAVFDAPYIRINPDHALTCSFDEMQGIVCHELIHAWLYRKGLDGLGEFLDDHHNEWFVRKALEINKKKIDRLNVSLYFLLTTPKGAEIYNRIADVPFTPHSQPQSTKELKDVAAETIETLRTFRLSKIDHFSRLVIIGLSVLATTLLLNKAHIIPDAVVSFVWWAWAVAIFLYGLLAILHRTRQSK